MARLNRYSYFVITTLFFLSLTLTALPYTANVYSARVNVTRTDTADKSPVTPVANDTEEVDEATKLRVQASYGKLPMSFIRNNGQLDNRVKYYERGGGHSTYFTEKGVYLALTGSRPLDAGEAEEERESERGGESTKDEDARAHPRPGEERNSGNRYTETICLAPLNANRDTEIVAEGVQKGKINYLTGNDLAKWNRDIPTYQSITYREIYDGIDMKFYGNNFQMEYDIVVKPGASPASVRLRYEGVEGLAVTGKGELEIGLKCGKVLQKRPYIYQEIDGKRVEVDGQFKIIDPKQHSYGFAVASYDKNRPLVIDPILSYSTYLGGNGADEGYGIAVDASGNAYVTGRTESTDFPLLNAYQGSLSGDDDCTSCHNSNSDAFVTKLDPNGGLSYSTYLGGSGTDYGHGIAVDASGNAYVTGRTESTDFPLLNAYQGDQSGYDAFVTKLDPTGGLSYSTYLGGNGFDKGYGIAVEAAGSAYVTGYTYSTDFPLLNEYQGNQTGTDVFVTKLDSNGSLSYSTYLGGSGTDYGFDIAVDASGNAYVTGSTYSTDFPLLNAYQGNQTGYDVFVTKLGPNGGLSYSTYLGGSGTDYGHDIAVDASGNAYVTGRTKSTDFPLLNAYQGDQSGYDAFVTKLDPTGGLSYSTYLGGNGTDKGYGIAVDASGNAYVTGYTYSTDFPLLNEYQGDQSGDDVFVTKLGPNGGLSFSTCLGGSGTDYGTDIAVDASGNAYVTGYTYSTDFPLLNAYQGNQTGYDVFVTKLSGFATLSNPISDQVTEEGVLFNFTIAPNTFTGGETLSYSAALSDDTPLSGWLSFDSATRTFNGTPSASDRGTVDIKVTVTIDGDMADDIFSLTVMLPSVLHLDTVGAGVIDSDSNGTLDSWNDLSGNGNNAYQTTEVSKPLIIYDAINGHRAIEFDGVNDVLTLDVSATLNTGGPYTAKTIIIAFRTGDDVSRRQVLYEQGGSGRGLNIYVENGTFYLNGWNLAEAAWGPGNVTGVVTANTDYLAMLVFDSAEETLSGYLNGYLMGSVAGVYDLYAHGSGIGLGGVIQDTYFNTGPYSGDGEYFKGFISDLICFNDLLSVSELTDLYKALIDKLQISGNSVPGLNIDAPTDGATFAETESITFTGTANDAEDGDLSASIQWSSDIDGSLGAGGGITTILSAGTHTVTAQITDSGGLPDTSTITVTVSEVATGITVSPISGLTTTEEGGTDTFEVVLDLMPVADVTIDLSSNDTTEGTVSPSSLTFTQSDWETSQTVTVTGVDDAVQDGFVAYSIITAAATSADPAYDGIDPPDVTVTNSYIDVNPPTVVSSYPGDGDTIPGDGSPLDMIIIIADAESGISSIAIYDEHGNDITDQVTIGGDYNDQTLSFTIPNPEDKTYTFTIVLVDMAGNTYTGTITFTVDSTPPVTTASQSGGTFARPFSVTLSCSEDSTIYYSTDNYPPFIGADNTASGTAPIEDIQINRNMNLQFFAVDIPENIEETRSEIYLLGTIPDTVTIASASFNAALQQVELSWDSASGQISGYRVYRCLSQFDVDILNQSHNGSYPPPASLRIAGTDSATTFYYDSAIVSGVTYYYGVTTVDADGTEGAVSTLAPVSIDGETSGDNDPYLKAMAWMESTQSKQGYWADKRRLRMLATSQALNAYKLMGKNDAATYHALFYLRGHSADNNDYLARKIITLSEYGQNVDEMVNRLIAQSHIEGVEIQGWGVATRFVIDAVSTALGAKAVELSTRESSFTNSAYDNFRNTPDLDSNVTDRFSWIPGRDPDLFVSGLVYNIVEEYYGTAIFDQSWISPNLNGSFGNGIIDTCAAIMWINSLSQVDIDSAVNYLITQQSDNGSWNNDPYTTGLCVEALKKSGYTP